MQIAVTQIHNKRGWRIFSKDGKFSDGISFLLAQLIGVERPTSRVCRWRGGNLKAEVESGHDRSRSSCPDNGDAGAKAHFLLYGLRALLLSSVQHCIALQAATLACSARSRKGGRPATAFLLTEVYAWIFRRRRETPRWLCAGFDVVGYGKCHTIYLHNIRSTCDIGDHCSDLELWYCPSPQCGLGDSTKCGQQR